MSLVIIVVLGSLLLAGGLLGGGGFLIALGFLMVAGAIVSGLRGSPAEAEAHYSTTHTPQEAGESHHSA